MISRPRVLGVQYANPAAYPPVEHAVHLLAEAGCDVALVGIRRAGDPLELACAGRVTADLLDAPATGWRQKAHYARFTARVLRWARRWRPDWLYVSDPLATPAALLAARACAAQVAYQEHDAPEPASSASREMRAVLRARAALARRAAVCIAPSAGRARRLGDDTGARSVEIVWNCPRRCDVADARTAPPRAGLRLLYHGSIVPARLPMTLLDALAGIDGATLGLAGYGTAGYPDYLTAFLARARQRGLADRVVWAGTLPTRAALLAHADRFDVGLALLPIDTTDVNEQTMLGASNKPFDYLARGLALLVSDRPEWRAACVETRLARACRPDDAPALAAELRWFAEHPAETRAMGERGRRRILDDWNYDQVFARVLELMMNAGRPALAPLPACSPAAPDARGH
jgi:glycosyltransferase involved in cell wall biosynthesis